MGLISWIYWVWFGEEHEAWSSCPGEEEEQCSSKKWWKVKKKKKLRCFKKNYVWANFALCSNCVWGSQTQYYPHSYKWSQEGPDPISRVRANEYPRTASRGMDKITIRGEVGHACEELGRVRGRWSPRDFSPRYLVNSLITQNNAWDKSYNRAKGEISNKK